MGEAWGVVCVPRSEDLRRFHPDSLKGAGKPFLEALFSTYGYEEDLKSRGLFKVENSLQIGRYLCLEVSEEGWPYFCEEVLRGSEGGEIYASFYSEYGMRSFYARTADGETFSFFRDDDGDDDPEEESEGLSDDETKWLALVDDELKTSLPPLFTYLSDRDLEDGDFDWDVYVRERHDGRVEELRESITALHEDLSTRTVESCARMLSDMSGLPASHPKIMEAAPEILEEFLDDFLRVLALLKDREPTHFYGEWQYGFKAQGGEPEGLPKALRSPRFIYKEDIGSFVLVQR